MIVAPTCAEDALIAAQRQLIADQSHIIMSQRLLIDELLETARRQGIETMLDPRLLDHRADWLN